MLTLNKVMGVAVALVLLGYLAVLQFGPDDPHFVKLTMLVMLGVVGGTAAFVSMGYVRRVRRQPFVDREPLTPEEIFSTYYKEDGLRSEVFVRLWQEIATLLALPAEKLRPTDRFDQELKPLDHWQFYDDHLEHLLVWVTQYADKRGVKLNVKEFRILDDLVKALVRL
jgi:hypothetical protein